jgi:RNA polymerase sigma factor (sigma-70 family)
MTISEYNSCVDEYADNLYRFMLKQTGDSPSAKDLVQESYLKLWQKHENVDYKKAKSYLFTTGYNKMIDNYRKNSRQELMPESHVKSHMHSEQYSDLSEVLEQALNILPEIQKTVIILRDYEGYSYNEIGEITNLKASQVKVYIYRGRLKLKEYLVSVEHVL